MELDSIAKFCKVKPNLRGGPAYATVPGPAQARDFKSKPSQPTFTSDVSGLPSTVYSKKKPADICCRRELIDLLSFSI